MKFAASVSLAALALAGCATNPPRCGASCRRRLTAPAAAAGRRADRRGRARVRRRGPKRTSFELVVHRAAARQWVNATYITDDTDALARPFRHRSAPRCRCSCANEAARYAHGPGPRLRHRSASSTSCAARSSLPAPTTPGAAAELNTISTRLQSTYGKGRGTLNGKPITGNDLEELMGTRPQPRPSSRRCGPAGTTMSAGRCARITPAWSRSPTRAPRSSATPTPARCGARATT